MFETELQNTKQKIFSLASGKEQISLMEILSWQIPQAVKDYFNIFAERILSEEILNVLYSRRFDQNNPEFVEARKKLTSSLKNAILFNRSEFENAVDKAVRFAINFVLRPEWTLAKIIFKNDSVKTKEQILEAFANFNEYAYYKKLIEKIFTKYQSEEIKLEVFQRLLRKIDEEVMRNVSIGDLISIVEPVYNFFKFANDSGLVPASALVIFFNDKGAESIVKEIELERDLHGRAKFSVSDLEIILKRVLKVSEVEEKAVEEKPVEVEPEVEKPLVVKEEAKKEEIKEEVEEKIEPQSEPKVKLPDLNSLLDEKMREKFVRKIFKRDETRFNEAIEKLNTIPTWKDASAFIDSIFVEFEIDPYSDEAIEFTDFVYRRYSTWVK
ncbi:hypothetical protein [Candidatus Chrysopegis kryptomonas]|jgi:hypothetical protein|uniref:Uncharacterized protein n=1 Tax=Candidatus Chryseopegocella kryptomonas TaxID=1633643 RepID=A0A0P1MUP1_9BACT|nr:hypothetical protein [Candidatus Chrysopegis kryptomonas]CUS99589.1 hypothetical protein JGI23_00690 [Candidatus Chrysopegis kryptomonas]